MTIYEFVQGPLALISFIIFFLGIIYKIIRFFQLTQKVESLSKDPSIRDSLSKEQNPPPEIQRKARYQVSILGMNPSMAIITSVFHVLLIVTPVFLLAHNILIEQSWGISLPSLPESYTDIFTIIILIFGVYFLFRRICLSRVRAVTSLSDYLIFLIVFVPFLTGFIAYHQFFAYKTIVILHIITSELMLICIPFTKLVHIVYFFLNRFFLKSEYSFVRGSRVWTRG